MKNMTESQPTQTAVSEPLPFLSDSTFLLASNLAGRYKYVQLVHQPYLISLRTQKYSLAAHNIADSSLESSLE
jgi:hypothetical protein